MPRRRPRHRGAGRAARQAEQAGREIRLSRATLAIPRRELARLAGVALSTISRIEVGDPGVQLNTLIAVADAVGLDIVIKAYPGRPPRLRDTGQLGVADALRRQLHPQWHPRLEVPAGDHGRSADLVLFGPDELLHLEIHRHATDYQAQYRAGAAKREFLASADSRPVRFVMVVEDTPRNRMAIAPHVPLLATQLPAGSREILAAIRTGRPLGKDGLLWMRMRSDRSIGRKSA